MNAHKVGSWLCSDHCTRQLHNLLDLETSLTEHHSVSKAAAKLVVLSVSPYCLKSNLSKYAKRYRSVLPTAFKGTAETKHVREALESRDQAGSVPQRNNST